MSSRPLAYRRAPLMVTFWVFSLLFGVGAALGSGWGLPMLLAWLFLATLTVMTTAQTSAATKPTPTAVPLRRLVPAPSPA